MTSEQVTSTSVGAKRVKHNRVCKEGRRPPYHVSDQDGLHLGGGEVTQDVGSKQRRHLENKNTDDLKDARGNAEHQRIQQRPVSLRHSAHATEEDHIRTKLVESECSPPQPVRPASHSSRQSDLNLLCIYLSEQHELGELPRQHEAQGGDAQGDHGCPARVPCSGGRRETEMRLIGTAEKRHKQVDHQMMGGAVSRQSATGLTSPPGRRSDKKTAFLQFGPAGSFLLRPSLEARR